MTTDINDLAQETFDTNEKNAYNEYPEEFAKGLKAAKKHLGNKGLLVVSEVAEGQDELRKGKNPWDIYLVDGKPEGYLVEMADAIIRLFGDMMEVIKAHPRELKGVTVFSIIRMKMDYNARRKDTAKTGIKAF